MKYYFLLPLCLVCLLSFGQEIDNTTDTFEIEDFQETDSIEIYKVKRLSFGIKLGIPNVAGLSLEGITPLLGNRIAPFVDFSSFPVNTVETDIDLKYSEFGSNFYFGKEGKGVYVGISFGTLKPEITFKDQEFEEDGNRGTGTVVVSTEIKTTNLKLGIKTGGRIFFRLELGYGIGTIPTTVELNGRFTYTDSDGITQPDTGTETEDFPAIPGVSTNGVLVGNFGFGVSF